MKISRFSVSLDNWRMDCPLLSIVVPIWNVEQYIRRAVDRILSQSFQDFEVILVDDGSPDGCPAICEEYCRKDSRCKVVHQQNRGLSGARNAGMKAASGRFITFCDPDDYYIDENALQCYADVVLGTKEDRVLFCSGYKTFDEGNGEIIDNRPPPQERLVSVKEALPVLEEYNLCGFTWNKLYSREIVEKNGLFFNENYSAHEDKLFLIQYLKYIDSVSIISVPTYCYIVRATSLSYNFKNISKRVEALHVVMEASKDLRMDHALDVIETRWCGSWLKTYFKKAFSGRGLRAYTNLERWVVFSSFIKISLRYVWLRIGPLGK